MPKDAPCPNCGAPATGRYCAECGQDNRQGRLEAKGIALEFFQNLFGWDSALTRTFGGLLRSPGKLVKEYVSGRRRRFINPARFCFLSLALWFVATRALGIDPMDAAGIQISGSSSGGAEAVANEVRAFLGRHLDVLMFLSLPLRAVLLRFFFRSTGKNLAESLVLVLYVAGFGYLVATLLTPLHALEQPWVAPLRPIVTLAWSLWAAREFFQLSWWSTLWRSLVVAALHTTGTVVLFGAIAVPWVLLTR